MDRLRESAERQSPPQRVTDMVVLCHGIDSPLPVGASKGQAMSHFSIALRQQAVFARCHVLTSVANFGHTFEGIDVLGARLMAEIEEEVAKEKLCPPGSKLRFSIVGHSLGGLIARHCVMLMAAKGHFAPAGGLFTPVSYMSLGTPHLSDAVGEALFRGTRTLDQLMLRDTDEADPLLVRMSRGTGPWVRALALFQHRTAVSAVNWDHQCTHSSSSITTRNQFCTSYAYLKYGLSFFASCSGVRDRLAGFSGFTDEYDAVLGYHKRSSKTHDAEQLLLSPDKNKLRFVTYNTHSQSYRRHPHEADLEGDDEIEHSHPYVRDIARGLWTLEWRRIDFELWTQFAHDALIGRPTIHLPCCRPKYGWKCVVKTVKVLAMDHLLCLLREDR